MNILPNPDEAAARLEAAGESGAAELIRAMQAELTLVRRERDGLADFARSIAGLSGHEMSHNSRLMVAAGKALDALRVSRRCPSRQNGEHWWMRAEPVRGARCASCHARRPGT